MENKSHRLMSEINMVPFIDIVLVLLIIFMISAPLMYRGIDIDLPQSSVNTIKQEQRILLTVDRNHNVFVDDEMVPINRLESVIQKKRTSQSDTTVYLKADRDVPYGTIVSVMDIVKSLGIDKLGMVTEPLKE
ncbi:MAG: protein TolR [Nitrospirae bacterium GWA2_42_11]|nr:MAG: protein TolR [Nitrospirae bacterium GWA2_42_11]